MINNLNMSHGKLRINKTCQNCGHTVEERYCSHCGQENTETRQRFHYLITHFIEDFVHYDGSFWATVKNLFFKPGYVTQEYLSGKRLSYVNPVKLYIFVSFITFFLLAFFPTKHSEIVFINTDKDVEINKIIDSLKTKDSLKITDLEFIKENISDSIRLKKDELLLEKTLADEPFFMNPITKKDFELRHSGVSREHQAKEFASKLFSMLPKGLFVYMPIFAFVLWIFYDKKKWWYFDHGIFTLHYFSVLLLSVLLISLLSRISDWIDIGFVSIIISLFNFVLFLYLIANFYMGIYTLYKESKSKTLVKGSIILFINSIIFLFILGSIAVYSLLNI